MRSLAALCFLAILGACAAGGTRDAAAPAEPPRQAWIVGADGRAIGQANFTAAPKGVLIRLEFSERALPPGWHGLHMHEVGTCSDVADGFRAAGAHEGHQEGVQHGLLNPAGPEAGDLPNLFAAPAGVFAAEFFAPHLRLSGETEDGEMVLLDADGAALVIHAGPDDQASQPIGGAGARIACAALTLTP